MKLITRDTDYAARVLCYMAQKRDKMISATELVNALKMPRPFTRKILQKLHKGGVLKAYKGKGGGFKLKQMPDKIRIVDLVKIFQGSTQLQHCLFKKKLCARRDTCVLRHKIKNIEEMIINKLANITIDKLI